MLNNIDSQELVFINGKDVFCDSLLIAAKFQKKHKTVLNSIKNLLDDLQTIGKVNGHNFMPSTYIDERGKTQPKYIMTRNDFSLLAMGFTGKEALKWKLLFIEAFELMEKKLFNDKYHIPKDINWLEARAESIKNRKSLTDRIKDFVDYAIEQGSETYKKKPSLAYINFTKMINKQLNVEGERKEQSSDKLLEIAVTEQVISKEIENKMKEKIQYKEIFQDSKEKVKIISNALSVNNLKLIK